MMAVLLRTHAKARRSYSRWHERNRAGVHAELAWSNFLKNLDALVDNANGPRGTSTSGSAPARRKRNGLYLDATRGMPPPRSSPTA